MPDATITSTASTFGTITGTFAADQSTITGTVTGVVVGTLDGSVGVPGIGVPDGGTTGQVLKKASNTSYDTVWGTDLNAPAWGNITGTLSSQTDLQTALDAKAPLASPAFTGNPTAPTAALADNDTSIATTAFVQQELASGVAVAKNLEVYVRNQTGSTLTAGTIVYINGATGNRPTVTKAQANNDANSAQTFGFVKTSIANNGFGYVIVRGECENLDTQGLTEGAQLYLSPTTAGTWTTTKPSAPQHLVYVGIVVRAHPTQGVILVAIQNGYELAEIHDVLIDTPSNGQVLKYDAAQGLWINGTDSSGVAWGGITGTLSSQTDLNTALGLKYDASNPSGFIDAAYLTTNNYATQSWVTGQNYITTAALSPYAPLSGASFSGLIVTAASSTSVAGFKLTIGSTPTSPVNGSMWATSSNIYFRINDISETFAFQSWVTSQLGSYLTSATAASTYQTQAGMSSYLTTSAAASTYAPLASPTFTGTVTIPAGASISGYATTASLSSYASLASPALTGTPTSTTAAADTNTTQIATTAYVVGQGYLKSATASSTYAPLASPALTGTPTAPTASAGTNTTQIATTAFVTAAVPAFATVAQSRAATSTTTSMNPSVSAWQLMHPGTVDIARGSLTYTATGTMGGTGTGFLVSRMTLGTAGACSANFRTFGGSQIDQTYGLWSKGYRSYIDFSKFIWCSGRFYTEDNINDPNVTVAFYCGKAQNSANGDLARAGFGWKFTGNATAGNRLFVVCAHNGTTLTTVTSSFAIVAQQYVDWDVVSNGSGTVTLYINGTQVATTTGGPTADTSYSGTAPVIWNEEMLTTGTSAGFNATFGRGRIYMAP